MGALDGILTDKGLRVVLPSGVGCYYVDEHRSEQMRHSYWRLKEDGDRGQRLTGVSTVSKAADLDPKHLLKWAARTNGIGIATLVGPILAGLREGAASPDELDWLTDHDTIWKTLEDAELTYDDVREVKATVGTNVHENAFRALAAGRPIPDFSGMNEAEVAFSMGVVAFWLDHDPKPVRAEQIVVDPELGVAGRLDLLTEIGRCDDGLCPCHTYEGVGVIDAKTSGFIPASHHVQVAGYREGVRVSGLGETNWGAILQLGDGGGYRLIDVKATAEDWAVCVALYRLVARINREAGAERRERDKATPEWRNGDG